MMKLEFTARPIQVPGKGWDVQLSCNGRSKILCEGRAPYTLAQAQVAAQSALRDYAHHQNGFDS